MATYSYNKTGEESGSLRQYKLVYQGQGVRIFQNDNVLPRAFVVYDVVSAPNFEAALDLLADPNLHLGQTAIVENLPPELANIVDQKGSQPQSVPGYAKLVSSGKIDIEVNTKAPGLLVVSDQYYPGWQAFIDGKQVTIYAVDGMFRGVFLEEGDHIIQFKYRPLTFIIGRIISVLSLFVTIVFVISKSKVLPNEYE